VGGWGLGGGGWAFSLGPTSLSMSSQKRGGVLKEKNGRGEKEDETTRGSGFPEMARSSKQIRGRKSPEDLGFFAGSEGEGRGLQPATYK